jgi:hypothetical protein
MDIDEVCKGLVDAAGVIDGLNPFDYGDKVVVPPGFFVAEVEQDFDSALEVGMDVAVFKCRLLVGKVDAAGARTVLNKYMNRSGTFSIKAALEADRTLGGACVEVFVARNFGPRAYNHQGVDYLGAQWDVRVTGRGE